MGDARHHLRRRHGFIRHVSGRTNIQVPVDAFDRVRGGKIVAHLPVQWQSTKTKQLVVGLHEGRGRQQPHVFGGATQWQTILLSFGPFIDHVLNFVKDNSSPRLLEETTRMERAKPLRTRSKCHANSIVSSGWHARIGSIEGKGKRIAGSHFINLVTQGIA